MHISNFHQQIWIEKKMTREFLITPLEVGTSVSVHELSSSSLAKGLFGKRASAMASFLVLATTKQCIEMDFRWTFQWKWHSTSPVFRFPIDLPSAMAITNNLNLLKRFQTLLFSILQRLTRNVCLKSIWIHSGTTPPQPPLLPTGIWPGTEQRPAHYTTMSHRPQ